MFIKSIVIDGFKSYGRKAELENFDPQFNAITGLNGSGKSNILDAICFVLGSSNMALARVTNLRELIFKAGQAGVLNASVCITFDNTDVKNRPFSYEAYNEIVVTREVNMQSRSKYLINGYIATTQQVTELFHSIQLNINNPHFLIMQGRITKVLNMKPQEILAMVEEATGASRFQIKKKASQASIEKKEADLRKIDFLLQDTIFPNLEKLKQEQSGLIEYRKIVADLEHKNKVLVAWCYICNLEKSQNTGSKVEARLKEISEYQSKIDELQEQIDHITSEISRLEREKDEEFGGALSQLEKTLEELQKEESKVQSKLNNAKETLKDLTNNKNNLLKQQADDTKALEVKQAEHEKAVADTQQIEENFNQDEAAFLQAQKDFEAISAGQSRAAGGGEAAGTLSDQLYQAKVELSSLSTQKTNDEAKKKHIKSEIATKTAEINKSKAAGHGDTKKLESLQSEVSKLQASLDKMKFDEQSYIEKRRQRTEMAREREMINRQVENLEHQSGVQFHYKDPGRGFDKRRVRGMVCQLINLKDPEAATALEVALGGRLYNIIVDDQETAKALLQRGELTRSHTFLPLDRIEGRSLDPNKLKYAQRLVGANNVRSALSLVEFDHDLSEAMKFVFADTLVCTDMDVAKKVAFDKNIRLRAVTLDGEIFDPSGTLSGGSRNTGPGILNSMANLQSKRSEFDEINVKVEKLETELRSLDRASEQYNQVKSQLSFKSQELDLLKKGMEGTNLYLLQQEVTDLQSELSQIEKRLSDFASTKKSLEGKIKQIEANMADSESLRNRELKEAQELVKKLQSKCDKSRGIATKKKQLIQTLKHEIEDIKQTIQGYTEPINDVTNEIQEAQTNLDCIEKEFNSLHQQVTSTNKKLIEQKKRLKGKSDEIGQLVKKKDKTCSDINTRKLKIRQIEHDTEQMKKEAEDAAHEVKLLLKKYPWIEEEKKDFGRESAGYPLKKTNFSPERLKADIADLQNKKNQLAKTVNMRANTMLVDREKECQDVMDKRKILDDDKKKLIEYMEEVEMKKRDEMEKAYVVINQHFGNIFRTLLPGTDAQLRPPAGSTIHDGLEVKVAFGDVWKESLAELSGGQRSLVALSLILALLRYNPAPIYILDEVDAALDQNHTTNIGRMIKENFPDSQFIIVSLKDDMFNNANVLFKTRFVDGSSTVVRTAKHTS